jgi:CBS domain-containing protein
MTRNVYSVDEGDTLEGLLTSMRTLRFRHIPVTQEERLVGLLSERDILRTSASSLLPNARQQNAFLQKQFPVRDVMQREVVSVTPDTLLTAAGNVLLSQRIDCLPVVDSENVLVGIITSTDFTKLALLALEGQ